MSSIVRYQKVTTPSTTYRLEPPEDASVTELCTIGEYTYVSVPDGARLPDQPEQITVEPVDLTSDLLAAVEDAASIVKRIDESVEAKIRGRYSLGDELKARRLDPSEYTAVVDAYIDKCVAEGRAAKDALGLALPS